MTCPKRLFILLFALVGYAAVPSLADPGSTPDVKPPQDSIPSPLDPVAVEYIPFEPDELIQDRLSCVEQEIPLHFNKYVRSYVDYFTIRNRNYSRRVLGREHVYFPIFEKYLAKYDLPEELKYLSVVESALLPKAVSRAKAVGLWQFMPVTGRDLRLRQDEYIDERMDPEKSTEAACKFLRQLYRIFGDWELALAAYNYGPGNVNKAIKRSGKHKPGFWEIYPHLPAETRNYVPTFAAIIYMMKYAPEHNIFADSLQFPIPTDTVLVNRSLDLGKFAAGLNMRPEELLHLNPALRKNYLPESTKNYPLKVPVEKREVLAMNRAAIFDSSRVLLPALQIQAPPVVLASKEDKPAPEPTAAQSDSKAAADTAKKTIYVVRKGDNLREIAQAYKVTVQELKEWNNLRSSTILPSQKLTVFRSEPVFANKPSEEATAEAQPQESPSAETPVVLASASAAPVVGSPRSTASEQVKKPTPAKKPVQKVQKFHSVQPGDTLWNISRRYEGLTVEQLKKVNKLKSDALKPGQKLVISTSS